MAGAHFDPQSDFAQVTDALEPATLRRADGSGSIALANALRRAVTTREAAASDGKYTTSDVATAFGGCGVASAAAIGGSDY